MKYNFVYTNGPEGHLSKESTPAESADSIPADDVEKVLEHVSSPFRWELLDIPDTQPGTLVPKKTGRHKSGSI